MTIIQHETDSPFAHTCRGCGVRFLPQESDINPFDETDIWHYRCGIEDIVENHYRNLDPNLLRKTGWAIHHFLRRNGSRIFATIAGSYIAFCAGYWLVRLSIFTG